jgi:D-alanyl-D-alanine carboxypeptidase
MPSGFTVAQLHAGQGNAQGQRLSVRQLLNHTSGLANIFFDRATAAELRVAFSERYILNILGVLPEALETHQWQGGRELLGYYFAQKYHEIPAGEPGAAFHYSDTNYFLLGLIIERVTGQTLAQAYRSRIFDRIGLNQAVLEWYEPRRAEPMPHYMNLQAIVDAAGLQLPQPLPPQLANADVVALGLNTSFDWAGGGLLLSANELDTFLRALLAGKLFQQPGTLTLMQNGVPVPGTSAAYGLGLIHRDIEGVACYGHGGSWGVEAWYCPSRDVSLVFASNQFVHDPEEESAQLLAKLLPILK